MMITVGARVEMGARYTTVAPVLGDAWAPTGAAGFCRYAHRAAFPAPPDEFSARQTRIPAPAAEDICEFAFNALERQRELTPGGAGLAGNFGIMAQVPQGAASGPCAQFYCAGRYYDPAGVHTSTD
jgi:hypothetical protein